MFWDSFGGRIGLSKVFDKLITGNSCFKNDYVLFILKILFCLGKFFSGLSGEKMFLGRIFAAELLGVKNNGCLGIIGKSLDFGMILKLILVLF